MSCKFWATHGIRFSFSVPNFQPWNYCHDFESNLHRTATHIHWSRRTGKTSASIRENYKCGGLVIFQAFFTKYKQRNATFCDHVIPSVILTDCNVISGTEIFVGFHASRRSDFFTRIRRGKASFVQNHCSDSDTNASMPAICICIEWFW